MRSRWGVWASTSPAQTPQKWCYNNFFAVLTDSFAFLTNLFPLFSLILQQFFE